jgi:subtilase family serine protease
MKNHFMFDIRCAFASAFIVTTLVALVACSERGITPSMPVINASEDGPHDIGRRDPLKPVRVVVSLRYNHQAELERLVDRLERTRRPQYLTREAFLSRFSPTVQEEQRVLAELQGAGFHVTHRYANRVLVDATAPSAMVERYFSTEIHDFRQPRYGVRSTNVTPLRIPVRLAADVTGVEVNGLVLAHRGVDRSLGNADASKGQNVVENGDFATGKLTPWTSCGSAKATISREHPHESAYDALTGSPTNKREVDGWSAICQTIAVPNRAALSSWLYQQTNEPDTKNAYQEIALADASGKPAVVLEKSNVSSASWIHKTWSLAKYAGKRETLFFGVYGTDRLNYYDTQFVDGVSVTGASSGPSPTPSASPIAGLSPGGGWGPSDTIAGFQLPAVGGYSGARQTAAIVIDATVSSSDIDEYLSNFGITRSGTIVNEAVDGGSGTTGEAEANLDLETIASLAPAANVIVYDVGELSNQEIEDAYNQVVSDGKATVVNSSFGECETLDSTFTSMTDSIALGAAAQGVTFSAASGDTGPLCFDGGNYVQGASAPASDPHFVGVGGTQSEQDTNPSSSATGSIANPAVWNDPMGAGGSGVSVVWTPPPYQTGVSGVQPSGRNEPDIAFPAAHDGLYLNGDWGQVWGTSWASPIYVAMQTEINQACATPQWGINVLYNAFAKSKYADFIDVRKGNNSVTGALGFSALPGFDNVSGIGIPIGTPLVSDTCK